MVAPSPAWAEKVDARKHYDRATAAFGLGKYAEAAAEYEAAFRLRPDPALLYNCAQSYRLAGDRARAIELYRNYLRLYGDAPNAEDARKHLGNLELAAAAERPALAAPAPRPMLPPAPAAAVAVTPPPAIPAAPPASEPVPPLVASAPVPPAPEVHVDAPVSAPAPAGDDGERPLVRRPWFWVAVGAVVVAGVAVALIATGGDKDPSASLGTVVAN